MKVKVISLPFIFQVLYVLCRFTRPTYQVSVYRTIGPLVFETGRKTTCPRGFLTRSDANLQAVY